MKILGGIKDGMVGSMRRIKWRVRREYLEEEVKDLEGEIAKLWKNLRDAEEKIQKYEEEKDHFLEKEKKLEQEKQEAKNMWENWKKTANSQASEIEKLHGDINERDNKIGNLDGKVKGLENEYSSLHSQLVNARDELGIAKNRLEINRIESNGYKAEVERRGEEINKLRRLIDDKYKDWSSRGPNKDGIYTFMRRKVGDPSSMFVIEKIPATLNFSDIVKIEEGGDDTYVYLRDITEGNTLKIPHSLYEYIYLLIERTLIEDYGVEEHQLLIMPKTLTLLSELTPKKMGLGMTTPDEEMPTPPEHIEDKIYGVVKEKNKIGEEVAIEDLEEWSGIKRERLHMPLSRLVKKGKCVRVRRGFYVFK